MIICKDEELKYKVDITTEEVNKMFAKHCSKDMLRTTYVDIDEVRYFQSLPKNLYKGEAKKKREAEIMERILHKKR